MAVAELNRKSVIVLISLTVVLVILTALSLKGALFSWMVERVQKKCQDKYGCSLLIDRHELEGFRVIHLDGVTLVPANGDTVIKVSNMTLTLRLGSLLLGRFEWKAISLDTCQISLVQRDSSDNFRWIFGQTGDDEAESALAPQGSRGWDSYLEAAVTKIGSWADKQVVVHRLVLDYSDTILEEQLVVPELYLSNGRLQASLITSSTDGVNLWLADGVFSDEGMGFRGNLKKARGGDFALPFLTHVDGLRVSFDSMEVGLRSRREAESMRIESRLRVFGGWLNHWRIAPEDVRVGEFACHLKVNAGADRLAVDSGSSIRFGQLTYALQANYLAGSYPRFRAGISFETDTADHFFRSLPTGMFHSLKGMKTKGGLRFRMNLDWPIEVPDSVQFEAGMERTNFSILSYGSEDFSRINESFSYLAMDGERPLRSIVIGPENSGFTPFDRIPSDLKSAVLVCEDPAFMQHRGFSPESFRESMVTNLKQRRFARGGSTISMQLVKNLFLSRSKSVARKLEEMLIVWLIEQNGLVSKERMFEVYLNIIEWGPDVYGVGEAARFYFNKSPSELTLPECIFMASIIPCPKAFKYRFDPSGNLKPDVQEFFAVVADRMVRKEMIPQVVVDGMEAKVDLLGPAGKIVMPVDSVPPDSLIPLPFIDLKN